MRILATLFAGLLLLVPSVAAEWPVHRFDFTHQGFDANNKQFAVFTDQWWKDTAIPATVKASPIVAEGRVYIGGWDKFLYALDSESGSVLWKTDLKAKITSTAAASESTVYAITESGALYALEARTGAIERQTSIGATFGTIAVHERRIFVGVNGGKVAAYEGDNFLHLWTFNLATKPSENPPPSCLRPDPEDPTGDPIGLPSGEVEGAPVVFGDQVLFGSTNHYFYAVSLQGNGDGSTSPKWCFDAQAAIRGSAAVDKANSRVIFGGMDGRLHSIAVSSGTSAWNHQQYQGTTTQNTPSQIQSSPAIAYDKVFFGANNGNIVAVKLSDGTVVWSKTTGGQVVSSPAVANNLVVVGSSDWNFYMLDQATGEVKWVNKGSRPIESSPAISGTQAFWGSTDGGLYSWGGPKPARADLIVSAVSGSLVAGVSGSISATIKNEGTLATNATQVQFLTVDRNKVTLLGTENLGALEAGAQKKVSTSLSPSGSTVTIRVVVDPANSIKEIDEGNNQKEQKLSITAAPSSTTDTAGGGGAPGLEAVVVVALIGAVALWRRRK